MDGSLGLLGLPAWFVKVYVASHRKWGNDLSLLPCWGLIGPETAASFKDVRSVGFSIVALCVPWCRHLESLKGITSQLYADNLKCTSYDADNFLEAAQYTVYCVQAAGQEASPSTCVLLSTSKSFRKRVKARRDSNVGCSWAVKLDVMSHSVLERALWLFGVPRFRHHLLVPLPMSGSSKCLSTRLTHLGAVTQHLWSSGTDSVRWGGIWHTGLLRKAVFSGY